MKQELSHCTENTCDPRIVCEQGKSKMTFDNQHRKAYKKIKVDGCLFQAKDGKKCDYLLESVDYADQYFVELKGSRGDTDTAVKQIESTIEKIPPRKEDAFRMAFAVFANGCPKITTHRQGIEKRFKKNGVSIRFCSTGYLHTLER